MSVVYSARGWGWGGGGGEKDCPRGVFSMGVGVFKVGGRRGCVSGVFSTWGRGG